MATLRTKATEEKYREHKANRKDTVCPLCTKEIKKEFEYWNLVENIFPYDRVTSLHDMIVSKEHVQEEGIKEEAWLELDRLKKTFFDENYEFMIEPMMHKKTIPAHYHLHFIVVGEE